MIRIQTITIRNFLSIGNCTQTVELGGSPLTLVVGENTDHGEGINRNGAGKSALLQATSYVLFGDPLTRISLDNLCNTYNTKGMLVTIEFERDGKTYRIERGRKPNVLRWFVDGSPNNALGKSDQTQDAIERVVGMSHRMFRHIVALNTFTLPFLREKASEQREIIEELLGITQLSQRAETLKKLLDVTKELLRDEEAKLKAITEANARIDHAIDRSRDEATTWQTAQDRHVAALLSRAEVVSDIDIDVEIAALDHIEQWTQQRRKIDEQIQATEREITALGREAKRLHHDLLRYRDEAIIIASGGEVSRLEQQRQALLSEAQDDIPATQIERLASEAARYRKDAAAQLGEAERLAADLDTLYYQLDHPDEHACPTCGQGLAGTSHADHVVAELQAQSVRLREQIESGVVISEQCNAKADAVDADIKAAHARHSQRRDECRCNATIIEAEIVAITTEATERRQIAVQKADAIQAVIDEVAQQETTHHAEVATAQARLKALGQKPISAYPTRDAIWKLRQERDALLHQIEAAMAKQNPHLHKIEGLQATLAAVEYDRLNDLTLKFKHETFLYKLLTAKDSFIRKRIVDQNLSYLNRRLDQYAVKLGLPHSVRFMADLSVEISLLGRDFDFEQLSRGEMSRVTLSTSWAFRDVWENLNTGFNLFLVDECLDQGMDGAGVEAAVSILSEIAGQEKNVFLISHREELKARCDYVLMASKKDNFTTFRAE